MTKDIRHTFNELASLFVNVAALALYRHHALHTCDILFCPTLFLEVLPYLKQGDTLYAGYDELEVNTVGKETSVPRS